MSAYVWLSLGSNIGDREAYLRFALRELAKHAQIELKAASSLYQTEPFGVSGQADYYNAVAGIVTSLAPYDLLQYINSIEAAAGRERGERWAARQLDIDILLYDKLVMREEKLTIPHAAMAGRPFVLIPLLEMAGNIEIPEMGYVQDLLAACVDEQKVTKIPLEHPLHGGWL